LLLSRLSTDRLAGLVQGSMFNLSELSPGFQDLNLER